MALAQEIKKVYGEEKKDGLKLEVLTKKNQRKGLCKDCARSENCSLNQNSENVVWDCDDYSDDAVTLSSVREKNNDTVQVNSNPGLCAFCIHSENCNLKQLEGGVWHCEEYQ